MKDYSELFALVDAGVGMRPAARRLGISPNAASGALSRRRGYRRHGPPGPPPERPAAAFTAQVGFRVDDDTLAQLDARAARLGVTRTQVVRDLVEWALEEFS